MKLNSTKLKKSLKETAKENAVVTKKVGREAEEVLKEGNPVNHPHKTIPNKFDSPAPSTVGISLGSTLNMGNYESLRIDVWISDSVQENETQQDAIERLREVADSSLEEMVNQYKD